MAHVGSDDRLMLSTSEVLNVNRSHGDLSDESRAVAASLLAKGSRTEATTMTSTDDETQDPATYVFIHGGGDVGWTWHLVEAELRARGHRTVAVDLPIEDDAAGLPEYADAVVAAVGEPGDGDLMVVAHSLGGLTAPLVCERLPVDLLVLLAAMVPLPGERPGDWWTATGYTDLPPMDGGVAADEGAPGSAGPADGGDDPDEETIASFLHDVPRPLAEEALRRGRGQSDTPMLAPHPLVAWPDVPTRFLIARDDRFFPASFLHRVVRERLGIEADEIGGSHGVALSRPGELAERLERYRVELATVPADR